MTAVVDALVDIAGAFVEVAQAGYSILRKIIQGLENIGKAVDLVTKAVSALLEIGKSIGNILEQALQFGARWALNCGYAFGGLNSALCIGAV